MKNRHINKLWGYARDGKTQEDVIAFTAGRDVRDVKAADYYLLPYDIWVNKAHCVMLLKQKIIENDDAKKILKGLIEIEKLASKNNFFLDPEKEDVHSNIESWLIQKYGIDSTGKLHTARSRNDQSATDVRLFLKDQIFTFVKNLVNLYESLVDSADQYKNTVMPGFTHHQHAMNTTFGHTLFAFASMFLRDIEKFKGAYRNLDKNPLGSAASYGTSFGIDRGLTSKYLGFFATEINSLDPITNRWEPEADLTYCVVSIMNHLSTLAQTLIILSTVEFGMIQIADQYTTGSSIMPQKKNPDALEVIKAKSAIAAGYLQNLISIGKAAFIGYNRDAQWTKYAICDLIDETAGAAPIMTGIIKTIQVNEKQMRYYSQKGFIGATSLMETICAKFNIPLRAGKIIIEKAIKYTKNKDEVEYEALIKALKEEEVKIKISEEQLKTWQDPEEIIKNYKSLGSPSLSEMEKSISLAGKQNSINKIWLEEKANIIENAKKLLDQEIKKVLS